MELTILIEQDEDGIYVGTVPEIEGCYTQAKTIPELLERIKEAIEVCVGAEPDINPMKFIGLQKIEFNNGKIGSNIREKALQDS
jgi:predicted RNase H-like HicB family nuclease